MQAEEVACAPVRVPRPSLLAIAIGFAIVCVAIVTMRPAEAHWSPDSYAKYLAVKSLRYDGSIRYDVPYLGRRYDPQLLNIPVGETFYDVRNGEVHISWPELFPILVFPFYRMLGWLGLFALPIFSGALSVYLTGKIAEYLRPRSGVIAASIVAVTTPLAVYSTLLWEHTPALALLLGELFLFVQFMDDRKYWKVAVGSSFVGLAAAGLRTDTNMFFLASAAALFFLTEGRARWKLVPVASVGFFGGAAPASALNWITNGKILAANTMKNAPPPSLTYLKQVHVNILPHFFAGKLVPLADAWAVIGGALLLALAHRFAKRPARTWLLVIAMTAMTAGSLAALVDVRVTNTDRFHGFLVMSPILALALLAPPPNADVKRKGLHFVLLTAGLLCLVNMCALAAAFPEGWTSDFNREWGPRYWLVIFPLLAIGVAGSYDALADSMQTLLERIGIWGGVGALLVACVLFELQGYAFIAESLEDSTLNRLAFEQNGDTPLLTDFFMTSSTSPEQFFSRPSFYIPVDSPGRFAEWLPIAANLGLARFDIATFQDPISHPFLHVPVPGFTLVLDGVSRFPHRDLRIFHMHVVRDATP